MPIETQISVFIKNRIGSLNDLCTSLTEANVNVRAMSTVDDVDWGIVGLIVDDNAKAKNVLEKLGLKFGESTVLTIELENKPGALASITKKLSEHNVSIVHTFVTAAGQRSLLVLMTTDNKRAEQILK